MAKGLSTNIIGNRVFIGPPLIISEAEIDELFDKLTEALDAIAAELAI